MLLNDRIIENKGYHVSNEVKEKACITCHSDHHGRNFKIINWDTTAFNHDLTGYVLKDKHAEAHCKSCHKPAHVMNQEIKEKKVHLYGFIKRMPELSSRLSPAKSG